MVQAYTEQQRAEALAAIAAGESIGKLSKTTGISRPTLLRWCAAQAGARQRKPGGGRKPLLQEADLAVLHELIKASGNSTLSELATGFTERTGKVVSDRTIAKGMKQLGFRKVKRQKAPSTPAPQTPQRYTEAHRREPAATTYPSSLTDREWAVLEPLLAKKDGRGRPPKIDKRRLLDAIFYQVRTGCAWRYMPKDLPHWSAVWSLFRRLRNSGVLEQMYDALHEQWRLVSGRQAEPTAAIVDSQSVKTTEKGGSAAMTRARKSRGASDTSSSIPLDFLAQS